jgi:hypothetical protein
MIFFYPYLHFLLQVIGFLHLVTVCILVMNHSLATGLLSECYQLLPVVLVRLVHYVVNLILHGRVVQVVIIILLFEIYIHGALLSLDMIKVLEIVVIVSISHQAKGFKYVSLLGCGLLWVFCLQVICQ